MLRSNETSSCSEIFRYVPNNGWHSLISPADWYAGVRLAVIGGTIFRDVTIPVNRALANMASAATDLRMSMSNISGVLDIHRHSQERLRWLEGLFVPGGDWNIGQEQMWSDTIRTTFFGANTPLAFRGYAMIPTDIGGFAFGYMGAEVNISLLQLYYSSNRLAGNPSNMDFMVAAGKERVGVEQNPAWLAQQRNLDFVEIGYNARRRR